MSVYLEELREDYHNDKVVPFIGAGLSVPFNVPTWKQLIEEITLKYAVGKREYIKSAVDMNLDLGDYWGAIDDLKKHAFIEDDEIQKEIVTLIRQRQIKLDDDSLHNYSDLANMRFKLHLTTNYEEILYRHLDCENIPIQLKDIESSTQNLFDERRVCHLHGFTSNSGTIVIGRTGYEKLYGEHKYDNILRLVTGTKRILFLGFSFDDQFIQTLISHHKESFKGTHYIILSDPPEEKIKKLREEYGLLTIPYSTEGSSHVQEIRKILQYVSKPLLDPSDQGSGGSANKPNGSEHEVIVGAGLPDRERDVEGNLFFRKLKLENIDADAIELAKLFYIAADTYIRELKKSGMSMRVIDAIFLKVFTKYKEHYVDTFKKYGDSQEFVTAVHKSLEVIDYGRYAELFQGNKSDENENRGLIHLLADEDNKVWWGDKRLAGI